MNSSKNDWSNIRGKKMEPKNPKKIDFSIIEKRLIISVKKEIEPLNSKKLLLPNKYSSWIIK